MDERDASNSSIADAALRPPASVRRRRPRRWSGRARTRPARRCGATVWQKANGGTLKLGSDLTAIALTTSFQIDSVNGSVLRIDGAVDPLVTVAFLGSSGVLELMDVAGGLLQGFNGKIASPRGKRDHRDEQDQHPGRGHQRRALGQHDHGVQWRHHRRHPRTGHHPNSRRVHAGAGRRPRWAAAIYFSATQPPLTPAGLVPGGRQATAATRATISPTSPHPGDHRHGD